MNPGRALTRAWKQIRTALARVPRIQTRPSGAAFALTRRADVLMNAPHGACQDGGSGGPPDPVAARKQSMSRTSLRLGLACALTLATAFASLRDARGDDKKK